MITATLTAPRPFQCWTHSPRDADTSVHVVQSPSVTCAAVECSPGVSVSPPPHSAPSTLDLQQVMQTHCIMNQSDSSIT